MQTLDKYYSQDDEFIHPLWLGILILFSVIMIIGTLCCLRIKCGSQLCHLLTKLFGRNIETNDNTSNDDKYSTINYPYNRPSIYLSTNNQTPKLYTIVNILRRAQLQKQEAIRQQNSNEAENEAEVDDFSQISISPLPPHGTRNSEIARKFYASMRNNSQTRNSASVDSYNNDASLASNTPLLNRGPPIKSNHEDQIKLFRTPRFFQSIPNQESLVITL